MSSTTTTNHTDSLTPAERAMVLEEANIYRAAIREHESFSECSRENLMVVHLRMAPDTTFSRQTLGYEVGASTPDAMPEHIVGKVQSTFNCGNLSCMPVARWHRWMADHYRRELGKLASEYSLSV